MPNISYTTITGKRAVINLDHVVHALETDEGVVVTFTTGERSLISAAFDTIINGFNNNVGSARSRNDCDGRRGGAGIGRRALV